MRTTSIKLFLFVTVVLASCSTAPTRPAVTLVPTVQLPTLPMGSPPVSTLAYLPNPASAYCEAQGNWAEIRTGADGSQTGYCILPDGSECDEWSYYRGTCGLAGFTPQPTTDAVNGWRTYRNEVLGYSFQYPADAEILIAAEPQRSLIVAGPGMGGESWVISHPSARDEFRPPEGVDLYQWLTDHYLVGEQRMPDTQIAGTLAIHFRHERSPQSPADDRYYFAWSGQLYMVLIGHGETENWELNNRFLQSFQLERQSLQVYIPTEFPTALPIITSDYQGWWKYTYPDPGFSILLPEDWVVEEVTTFDPLMNGHTLTLHPINYEKENIRMTFRRVGETVPLWPTGVGSGEFIPQGTLDVAGAPARRILFVCLTGEVTAIWYHDTDEDQPNISRGKLEFGFIYNYGYCEPGFSLGGKIQRVGEMIIASLKVP